MKHEYEFQVLLVGEGETPELAWLDAVHKFCKEEGILQPALAPAEEFINE
jgi:hypothetical protein